LAVSCANLFPYSQVAAVDISCPALRIARRNARFHQVLERVSFFQGDLLGAVRVDSFDIVMANLPYVPLVTRSALSPEVFCYEPEIALFAGSDGLDCYRALAVAIGANMKSGALLMCEIDSSQGSAMIDLFSGIATTVRIMKDYSGQDRIAVVVF
jgi:release factor glutamine methyltransferase